VDDAFGFDEANDAIRTPHHHLLTPVATRHVLGSGIPHNSKEEMTMFDVRKRAGSHLVIILAAIAAVVALGSARADAQDGCSSNTLVLTEIDLGGTDGLEIQNVSGGSLATAGWIVAISDTPYSDLDTVNPIVQALPPTMAADEILYWTDATSDNYWGNNMFWNPGEFPSFSGWAIILDDTGAVVDFAAWNGIPEADIAGMSLSIDGYTVTIGDEWLLDGIITDVNCPSGFSVQRQGSADHNDAIDWTCQMSDLGAQNPGLTTPFVDDCAVSVHLDIRPRGCPNPFNPRSMGYLPAALLGTEIFDVADIDLATLEIARADGVGGSVAPHEGWPGPHATYADVATPFNGEVCDCHTLAEDGIVDLRFVFAIDELVAALELNGLSPGETVELVVTGELLDGTLFEAHDCITR
jgi:hypothetical protein